MDKDSKVETTDLLLVVYRVMMEISISNHIYGTYGLLTNNQA